MSNPVCFLLDDLPRDFAQTIRWLDEYHSLNRQFRLTVFAIPAEMENSHWEALRERNEWLRVGIHGFDHVRGECKPGIDEILDFPAKIQQWADSRFRPIFAAPWGNYNWASSLMLQEAGYSLVCNWSLDLLGIGKPKPVPEDWESDKRIPEFGIKAFCKMSADYECWNPHAGHCISTPLYRRHKLYRDRIQRPEYKFLFAEDCLRWV